MSGCPVSGPVSGLVAGPVAGHPVAGPVMITSSQTRIYPLTGGRNTKGVVLLLLRPLLLRTEVRDVNVIVPGPENVLISVTLAVERDLLLLDDTINVIIDRLGVTLGLLLVLLDDISLGEGHLFCQLRLTELLWLSL